MTGRLHFRQSREVRCNVPAALVGAGTLNLFEQLPVVVSYALGGSPFEVTVVKAIIGVLIVAFALWELRRLPP